MSRLPSWQGRWRWGSVGSLPPRCTDQVPYLQRVTEFRGVGEAPAPISRNRRRGWRVYTVYIFMKIWGRSLVVCLGLVCLSAAHGQQYTIQTLAGNGSSGFAGDNGDPAASQLNSPGAVALDSKGDIYIADTGNHRIRKISGGAITTIAGTGTLGYSGDGAAA